MFPQYQDKQCKGIQKKNYILENWLNPIPHTRTQQIIYLPALWRKTYLKYENGNTCEKSS